MKALSAAGAQSPTHTDSPTNPGANAAGSIRLKPHERECGEVRAPCGAPTVAAGRAINAIRGQDSDQNSNVDDGAYRAPEKPDGCGALMRTDCPRDRGEPQRRYRQGESARALPLQEGGWQVGRGG